MNPNSKKAGALGGISSSDLLNLVMSQDDVSGTKFLYGEENEPFEP